jgi:hypothetical protein
VEKIKKSERNDSCQNESSDDDGEAARMGPMEREEQPNTTTAQERQS